MLTKTNVRPVYFVRFDPALDHRLMILCLNCTEVLYPKEIQIGNSSERLNIEIDRSFSVGHSSMLERVANEARELAMGFDFAKIDKVFRSRFVGLAVSDSEPLTISTLKIGFELTTKTLFDLPRFQLSILQRQSALMDDSEFTVPIGIEVVTSAYFTKLGSGDCIPLKLGIIAACLVLETVDEKGHGSGTIYCSGNAGIEVGQVLQSTQESMIGHGRIQIKGDICLVTCIEL